MRITLYMKQFRKQTLKFQKQRPPSLEKTESRIKSIFIRLTHSFFNTDTAAKKHKVLWEDSGLPFDKVPFVVVNHKVYDCQHGVDRHLSEKKRNQAVGFY